MEEKFLQTFFHMTIIDNLSLRSRNLCCLRTLYTTKNIIIL